MQTSDGLSLAKPRRDLLKDYEISLEDSAALKSDLRRMRDDLKGFELHVTVFCTSNWPHASASDLARCRVTPVMQEAMTRFQSLYGDSHRRGRKLKWLLSRVFFCVCVLGFLSVSDTHSLHCVCRGPLRSLSVRNNPSRRHILW